MANKQISDLPSKTFGADSLVAHDVPNTNPSTMTQYPYVTGNATGNAVANFVANGLDYTTDLSTENKKITGAINELHSSIGADTYDENETYNKGDTVIHNGTLYACKDNSVTGTWDASHWDDTTLQPKTDNTLSTTDKTVVGAINELKSGQPTFVGEIVLDFGTTGIATISFSDLHVTSTPSCIVVTNVTMDHAIIQYDKSSSTTQVVFKGRKIDNSVLDSYRGINIICYQ